MSKLERLQPNAAIRGILPDGLVTVVSVQWLGSEAFELTYKTATDRVANELLYRHDEPRVEIVEQGRPWSFDGDGGVGRGGRRRVARQGGVVVEVDVVEPEVAARAGRQAPLAVGGQATGFSPVACASPRSLGAVKPRSSWTWPKTGSMIAEVTGARRCSDAGVR